MKTIQAIAALLLVSVFFASCDDILFEHPQPPWVNKDETTFPEKLRGMYISPKGDTIRISATSIGPLHPKKDDIIFSLSDSLLLRSDKENYYLNMKAEQYWDVILERIKGDSLITYTLNGKDEEVGKAIEKITRLKKTKEDSSSYVINPSADEFKKILDKNIFRQGDVYLKVH